MAPADPPEVVHRLDELLHEVDELRGRINAAREEERRHEDRRILPRESPDRRAVSPLERNRVRMLHAHT